MDLAIGRFHISDGLCVERTPDGGVRVMKFPPGVDAFDRASAPTWEQTLTDSSWASVVAHVSARGESGETYEAALRFHREPRTRLGPWVCGSCGESRPRSGTIGASTIPCPKCGGAMSPFQIAYEER